MISDDGPSSISSAIKGYIQQPNPPPKPISNPVKRKRNLPGTPDPDAEVIALSPNSLTATNRFVCEVCNKGFQRDQNLQLHRRGHNLPWKLKQRASKEVRKKVYLCPEKSCVHHDPARALGDLTGVKKHYSRKHGEKKWKCEKCSKKYAVRSDWKAHSKICGTREYKCECGTLFSRKDSFATHRAFCEVIAGQSAMLINTSTPTTNLNFTNDFLREAISNDIHHQAAGNPQFSTIFRPESVHEFAPSRQLILDEQNSRPPLWLDQNTFHLNAFGAGGNSSGFNQLSSTASLPELVQHSQTDTSSQTQWANGAHEASNSGNFDFLPSALQRGPKEEESMGSFYYISQQEDQVVEKQMVDLQAHTKTLGHMSLPELLQRAAQMEPTTRTNSSLLGGGLGGLMSSSTSNIENSNLFSSFSQCKHGVEKFPQPPNQQLFEMNPSSTVTDNNGDGLVLLLGDINSGSNSVSTHFMVMPKQSKTSCSEIDQCGMTRDFLGVGQDQLDKFVSSMGSTMEYNGRH